MTGHATRVARDHCLAPARVDAPLSGGRYRSLFEDLAPHVQKAVPDAALGEQPDLTARVVVLTVKQAKGLEFDGVIVVDPERMVEESPRGANDLYVALTRATQRLGVLHQGPLPTALAGLTER